MSVFYNINTIAEVLFRYLQSRANDFLPLVSKYKRIKKPLKILKQYSNKDNEASEIKLIVW